MAKRILFIGFDLSLSSTGIVILNESQNVVHEQILTPPEELDGLRRLMWFEKKMDDLMTEWATPFNEVYAAVESCGFSRNRGFESLLQELNGAMRLVIARHIPVEHIIHVSPGNVKKFATADHQAPKSVMMLHVYKRWGVDYSERGKSGEDLADAYCLARFYAAWYFWQMIDASRAPDHEFQRDALMGVLGPKKPKAKKKKKAKAEKAEKPKRTRKAKNG